MLADSIRNCRTLMCAADSNRKRYIPTMSAALSCQCDGPVNYVAIQILLAADCMQKNMCRELECAEHQDKDMRHETMIPAVRKQWKANPSANSARINSIFRGSSPPRVWPFPNTLPGRDARSTAVKSTLTLWSNFAASGYFECNFDMTTTPSTLYKKSAGSSEYISSCYDSACQSQSEYELLCTFW